MGGKIKSFYLRFRKNRKHLLILVGIIVFIDLVLRIPYPVPEYTYFHAHEPSFWGEDPELLWIDAKMVPLLTKRIRKERSERLIYLFGGSIPTSHRTQINFPTVLQHKLGDSAAVINFATGGYTSFQSLGLYKRIIKEKHPATVIVCHATNDSANGPLSDAQMAKRNERFGTKVLYYLSKSRIISLMRRMTKRAVNYGEYDPYSSDMHEGFFRRVDIDEHRKNMEQFARIAREGGSDLVFLTQGNVAKSEIRNLENYFAIQKEVADAYSWVYYLDVRPEVTKVVEKELGALPEYYSDKFSSLFVDWCHLSDEGHRFIGAMLYEFLVSKNLVKPNT